MSSVVMQAEDMLFKDQEVKEVENRLVNILANSFNFYELYADGTEASSKSKNVLDRWILSRLNQLITDVTEALDKYDTVRATRPLKDFVGDLSTWYIRRSRERLRGGNKESIGTLRFIFLEFSKLIAPIMPFIAEEIYLKVRDDKDSESVHLCEWCSPPAKGEAPKAEGVLENMSEARRIVSLALEQRQKANIKVRQPLAKLEIRNSKIESGYLEIIKDEINVKEIVENQNIAEEVKLDTSLTSELIEEGKLRDAIRAIQDWRKEQGLKPGEKVEYKTSDEFLLKHKEEVEKATNIELSYLHD